MISRHLLAFLYILLGLALGACRGEREARPGDMQTLLATNKRHVVNEASELVGIFPDGQHALLSDSVFGSERLFLVDMVEGTVSILPIARQENFRFSAVPNGMVIDLGPQRGLGHQVLMVAPTGQMRMLDYLNIGLSVMGEYNRVVAERERVEALLAAGQLEGLTEIEEYFYDEGQPRHFAPSAFVNENYYIDINPANERDPPRLREHTAGRFVRDYVTDIEPNYPGLRFVVTRLPPADTAAARNNRAIRRIEIQSATTRYAYEFNLSRQPLELFYYTLVVGDRLYILGDDVRFIELAPLVAASGS